MLTKNNVIIRRIYRGRAPLNMGSPRMFLFNHLPHQIIHQDPNANQKPSAAMQTRAMKRKALADGTPAADSTAMDNSLDTTSAIKSELEDHPPPSWDSVCVDSSCPITHPHNFGLRPQTSSAPELVRHDAGAAINTDRGYPDTQPPPLIKAMIDTLRIDRNLTIRYESFTDILRDFYHAHGGRSDKYHRSAGMFGLGLYLTHDQHGDGVCVFHKHPEGVDNGRWFEFESPRFAIPPIQRRVALNGTCLYG